jgi:NADPH2:quinone reductase
MGANLRLCGVMLAYAPAPVGKMMKKGMGWNFVDTELGKRITREIVELVQQKKVRPVIGQVVAFEEIPAAIEAMANRETVGRTIVRLY